jgi:hypothetical protein
MVSLYMVNFITTKSGHIERKIADHTAGSVKRRDPGIQQLARRYNTACVDLAKLVQACQAPSNAVAPEVIPMDRLFDLDVDDSIWQDVGLDETNDAAEPPLWLCNEKVRSGIRAVVVRDRCDEEIRRVLLEQRALHEWFEEEWKVVVDSIHEISSPGEYWTKNCFKDKLKAGRYIVPAGGAEKTPYTSLYSLG